MKTTLIFVLAGIVLGIWAAVLERAMARDRIVVECSTRAEQAREEVKPARVWRWM